MKPTARLRSFLFLAGSALLAISSASAQTPYYWDSNGTTAGFGSSNGTWGSSTFWSTSAAGTAATANTTINLVNDVFFGTSANGYTGTVTLSAARNARLVTFGSANSGPVTLTAQTLNLGTDGGINAQSDATISSALTISGAQTFTVASGKTLTLDTGAFTRNAGATLSIQNSGTLLSSKAGLGTGNLGAWASIGSGTSTSYATNDGSNIVALTGTDAATAADLVSDANANYNLAGASGTVADSMSANTIRYTGSGGTTAPGATLFQVNGLMNAGTGAWTLGPNQITIGAVGSTRELVVNTANAGMTISGTIANNSGGASILTKTGGHTLTLTAANTYTGATNINGGSLVLSGSGALNTGTAVTVQGGGTFDISGISGTGATTGTLAGAIGSSIVLGDKNLTINQTATGNYAGVISGNGSLTKTGSGKLSLGGVNTFNSLVMDGGTVGISTNGTDTLGAAGSLITVKSNTILINDASGAISFNKRLQVDGGARLTLTNGNAGFTFQGVVSGSGAIDVTGAGSIAQRTVNLINTANTFTGAIELTQSMSTIAVGSLSDAVGSGNIIFGLGTASRNSAFQLGTTAVAPLVLNNLRIEINAGASAAGFAMIYSNNATVGNTLTINSDLLVTGTGGTKTLELRGTNTGNNTFSGVIANGGLATLNLTKSDAGTWVVSGGNSYNGTTTVSGGTLIARSGSALGTGTGANVTVATQTGLHYNAATDTALQIGGNLGITGGTLTNIGASIGSTTTSARINVAGNATTTTAAVRVNLYGNSFSTTDAITGGTGTYTLLQGGGTNSLNNATYSLGTVFNATNFTVGGISKSADAVTADITAATALTSVYWKGTATAGITQVWAASNGSTTSNWTDTDGGTVQSLVPGADADVIITGTSLTTNPTNTRLGADMSIKSLTLSNALGLNGDGSRLTIGTGGITMQTGVGSSTIGANVALGANQTWTNNSTNNLTVSGVVSGSGTLEKAGAGTVNLTGTNTYTGATTVADGTLLINGNISTSVLTTVQTGATLGGSGTVGALTIDSGGFFSPGNSPGITTVDGNYIQDGTLQVEIEGLTAGNGAGFHDQVDVTGTVTLGGALSILSFSGTYAANDLIFILLNDGTDAITGTFTGLAQGAVVGNYAGFDWQISYIADSTANTFTGTSNGNDIALMAVPEPGAALLGGLGVLLLLRRRR